MAYAGSVTNAVLQSMAGWIAAGLLVHCGLAHRPWPGVGATAIDARINLDEGVATLGTGDGNSSTRDSATSQESALDASNSYYTYDPSDASDSGGHEFNDAVETAVMDVASPGQDSA